MSEVIDKPKAKKTKKVKLDNEFKDALKDEKAYVVAFAIEDKRGTWKMKLRKCPCCGGRGCQRLVMRGFVNVKEDMSSGSLVLLATFVRERKDATRLPFEKAMYIISNGNAGRIGDVPRFHKATFNLEDA